MEKKLNSMNISLNKKAINGFTLIEILVAVAILSIVLAAIYNTFFLLQRAIDSSDETTTKLQEIRKAIDIIRCELESSVFEESIKDTQITIRDKDFYGKPASQVIFTTFSSLRPGLSKLTYYAEEKDRKLILYKKIESTLSDENDNTAELIEGIEGFLVEAKFDNKWVKTWDSELSNKAPEQIRITFVIKIKDREIILTDIAKPMYGKSI